MEGKVNAVLITYFKLLKNFDMGMVVTKNGDFIFEDRTTGEQVGVEGKSLVKLYDEI